MSLMATLSDVGLKELFDELTRNLKEHGLGNIWTRAHVLVNGIIHSNAHVTSRIYKTHSCRLMIYFPLQFRFTQAPSSGGDTWQKFSSAFA